MTDKQLVKFTAAFRRGLLGKRPSHLMCAAVSLPLSGLLNAHGIENEIIETDLGDINHFWIRLADGRALDPTADQFNELFSMNLPPVYLGPLLTIHGAAHRKAMEAGNG